MTKKNVKKTVNTDISRGKGLFNGEYPLNEKGCQALAKDMVKYGLATAYKQDRAWTWIDIPRDKADRIQALDVPAFRVFFEHFSPKRQQWFAMGRSLMVLADRASYYRVALSSDGKCLLNEYDMQAEGVEDTLKEAEKKAKGEKNNWPQARQVSQEKVAKKVESIPTEDLVKLMKARGYDVSQVKK